MRFVLFFITTVAMAGQFTTALNGTYPYSVSAITTDAAGNTYVVGSRTLPGSAVFINPSIDQPDTDVFVSKLDPNGNVLFTNTFAGKGIDTGTAITVDPSGNIFIAGSTTSPDFPLSHPLQSQIYPSGGGSGFVMKLTGDGSTILYSTFFGGTLGQSAITSLATDSSGNLYLTGYTQASDFPHSAGMPFGNITQSPEQPGVILASISAAGDKILYSGAIVGSTPCASIGDNSCISNGRSWEGIGVSLDAAGNAYYAGNFDATDLATTPGVLSSTGTGAFVAKVNAGGTGLGYLTYLAPDFLTDGPFITPLSYIYAMAVDAAGDVYVTGQTQDPKFPATPGAYQTSGQGGFVAKVNPTGTALVWATLLDNVQPQSIAIDASGNVWTTGTASSGFPNANGWTTGPEYLAELNAAGSKLSYSALYPTGTMAQAVAVDPSGGVHTAGSVGFISSITPAGPQSTHIFGLENAAGYQSITARVSPAEVVAIYGPNIGPATAMAATPVNGFYPQTLGGIQVTINGANIPLLYVSQNQINAVVPMGLEPNGSVTMRLTNGTTASPDYPVWIVASSPDAFTTVLNQDGTINSQSNPAKGGSIVTFYATGWQSSFAPLVDGQLATQAQDFCQGKCVANASYTPITPPTGFSYARPAEVPVTITATALYGGAAPTLVAGVSQFNVQIGTYTSPTGPTSFQVAVTGGPENATVYDGVWITP